MGDAATPCNVRILGYVYNIKYIKYKVCIVSTPASRDLWFYSTFNQLLY